MQRGDNRTPYTNDWNLSVAEALPWRSVLEVSYIGNQSRNELLNGSNGKIDDLNAVQPGGYYSADPTTRFNPTAPCMPRRVRSPCNNNNSTTDPTDYVNCGAAGPNGVALSNNYNHSFTQNNYRPLTNYTDIYLITHGSYANYNAMQVSWKKQSGPLSFFLNYTFGKAMGIRDGQSDNGATNGVAGRSL